MNSGMYSALSGSISAMKRLDVISNNLANVNTAGFKKDKMLFESMLSSIENPPPFPVGTTADPILQKDTGYIDHTAGTVSQTGNIFDLAINGDGFFVVETPTGQAYTRQGNFHLSIDGILVNADGNPVVGESGSITIKGSKIVVDSKGQITADGASVGTIKVVDFPRPYNLTKTNGALFVPADPQVTTQTASVQISQGFLESSNVDTISEMAQMIETNRYFEACTKVIKGYDDMTAKAVNDLGRLQ